MNSQTSKAQDFRARTFTAAICQKKKEKTRHLLPNKFSYSLRCVFDIKGEEKKTKKEGGI